MATFTSPCGCEVLYILRTGKGTIVETDFSLVVHASDRTLFVRVLFDEAAHEDIPIVVVGSDHTDVICARGRSRYLWNGCSIRIV